MTNKEALELELATPLTYIERNGVYYEVPVWVERDLEVLEILKGMLITKTECFDGSDMELHRNYSLGFQDNNSDLSLDEYKIIKEWLNENNSITK